METLDGHKPESSILRSCSLAMPAPSFITVRIGFALGIGVLLVGTHDGLFCFDLKSGQVKKLCEKTCHVPSIDLIVPYINFYTPGTGLLD